MYWRMLLKLAIGVALACSAAAVQVAAQEQRFNLTLEEAVRRWSEFDDRQHAELLEQLIALGRIEDADRLMAATRFAPASRDRAALITALLHRAHGRHAEAAGMFRQLLAGHPEYDRVRLELARTLVLMNEDESARHHFNLLLGSSANSPEVEKTVRGFINTLDRRRRWQASAYVTVAPSTNINQGSEQRVVTINGLPFVIDDASRQQSGVGVVAGAQFGYRLPLDRDLDLVVAGGGQTKRYDAEAFNDTIVNASIGPRWNFADGNFGLFAIADHRWLAEADYSTSIGLLASAFIRLDNQNGINADASCSLRGFETDWKGSDLSYQDGSVCGLDLRFAHAWSSVSVSRLLGGAGREQTGRDHLDNISGYLGLGQYYDLPYGITFYGEGKVTARTYDGIYPTATDNRQDLRLDATINLTKRDFEIAGFAPMLQYSYTHNDSNIGLHDFDAHSVNLTFTKAF